MDHRTDERWREDFLVDEKLLIAVVVAAAANPDRLTASQIDEALDVVPADDVQAHVPGQVRRKVVVLEWLRWKSGAGS